MKSAPLALLLLLIAGCASRAPAPLSEPAAPTVLEGAPKAAAPALTPGGTYTVKKGETLFGIARAHGLNRRDLAAWIARIWRLHPSSDQ
ncbi:MAG: LysM peptidoglycan-binding domain-containing protein [Rhodocyclaceae bacterium]|nr:LysM peptidoglycan-binding domain-containing protein [Rhodocyclaceae bacterium]